MRAKWAVMAAMLMLTLAVAAPGVVFGQDQDKRPAQPLLQDFYSAR